MSFRVKYTGNISLPAIWYTIIKDGAPIGKVYVLMTPRGPRFDSQFFDFEGNPLETGEYELHADIHQQVFVIPGIFVQ